MPRLELESLALLFGNPKDDYLSPIAHGAYMVAGRKLIAEVKRLYAVLDAFTEEDESEIVAMSARYSAICYPLLHKIQQAREAVA